MYVWNVFCFGRKVVILFVLRNCLTLSGGLFDQAQPQKTTHSQANTVREEVRITRLSISEKEDVPMETIRAAKLPSANPAQRKLDYIAHLKRAFNTYNYGISSYDWYIRRTLVADPLGVFKEIAIDELNLFNKESKSYEFIHKVCKENLKVDKLFFNDDLNDVQRNHIFAYFLSSLLHHFVSKSIPPPKPTSEDSSPRQRKAGIDAMDDSSSETVEEEKGSVWVEPPIAPKPWVPELIVEHAIRFALQFSPNVFSKTHILSKCFLKTLFFVFLCFGIVF